MTSIFGRPLLLLSASVLTCLLGACTGGNSIRGLPRNLPKIDLYGSSATPPHSMEKGDYPFDENGNYMTSWAALRGTPASGADIDKWKSSHGGSVSKKQPSRVKKVKSSGGGSYTIKSGDTLSAIARRNNTTVAKLKAANGLSSDLIRAGKTLKIPK